MIVRAPTLVVIGGGEVGERYVRQLLRALAARRLEADRIVVVDRDPRCAARAHRDARLRFDVADWSEWLDANLEGCGPGAHVVPYHWAPHLFLDWLRRQLARAGASERKGGAWPLRGTPYEGTTGAGDRALSYATWPCPPMCIEPALCPHTRGPRDWSLAADLEAPRGDERFDGHVVFRCLHWSRHRHHAGREILGARGTAGRALGRDDARISSRRRATVTAWHAPDDRVGDSLPTAAMTSEVIAFPGRPTQVACMGGRAMERRALFGSMLSAAAGAALSGVRVAGAAPARDGAFVDGRARQFLDAGDGTSLFFKDWGSGPPLVFVSAWGLNADAWMYETTYLAGQGLRCVAYDRRGHGRSSQPARGYDFDTLADDLSVLLETLDLREVTLVGHSMGCAEVVRYLVRYGGSRVARAVLVSTVTPCTVKTADNPDGVDRGVLEAGRAMLRRDFPGTVDEAAPGFFGPQNPVSAATRSWWTGMILQCSLPALLELHRAFTETDFRPELRALPVPALLVHGDSDVSTPLALTGRRSAALIPRSRLEVYPGAAHGLPLTHVDRLNADVLAFARA